jgi:hypothetical protein
MEDTSGQEVIQPCVAKLFQFTLNVGRAPKFTACATPFGRHHASACTAEHAESIILIATLVGVSERNCSLNQMNREPGGGDFISNACLITPENAPLRFQIGKGGIILLRGFCSEEWT